MTDMRRITVSFPDDIDQALIELRKQDGFERCSYSEIIRRLVRAGLAAADRVNQEDTVSTLPIRMVRLLGSSQVYSLPQSSAVTDALWNRSAILGAYLIA